MLGRTRPKPVAPAPRRPEPDQQCTGTALKSGRRCTQWGTRDGRCHSHPHPPAHSLTASVAVVQLDGVAWQTWKFGARAWQTEAWRLYDITGQLRFVANWVGNSVSRCRLFVAEVDESGEAGEEATDPDVAQLAAGPLGRGPAKDEALRLLGINLFVAGEAYIIAEADALDGGGDRWFVVSGRQITRTGGDVKIRRSQLDGGGDMIYREGVDLILRVWTPHPADTDEPDSPTRSAIPDLREIEAIRKREFAELDSRLAGAGLLPLPAEADFPRGPEDPAGVEGFMKLLTRAMSTSLQDRSSAEAMVPIMFTVPGEYLDKIKQVTFWSELSKELLPMRKAAIESLAQSLDVPAEILTGLGDSTHWNAWIISDDAIQTQIVPVLSRIADALTTGYLRRALEQMGDDPEGHVYGLDTAALTTRPNRSADALNYFGVGLISAAAAVEAGSFREDQRPDDEERLKAFVERAVTAAPSLLADPALREIIGITTPAPPAVDPNAPPPAPTPTPAPAKDPKAQPDQPAEGAALTTVANLVMRRALTLAGSRLVPHGQRDRYPGVVRHQLHSRHGAITRDHADRVLRGAWEDLPSVADDLNLDAGQLEGLLHGFAVELLTRGMAYDQRLLTDLVAAAVRGRRLDTFVGLAA